MGNRSAPTSVATAELSGAPQGCTARLTLDLGYADAAADAVVRDLAAGVLARIQALLAAPGSALPAYLRAALGGLADALAEQTAGPAPVTTLDTPLARAWHAHPAGKDR